MNAKTTEPKTDYCPYANCECPFRGEYWIEKHKRKEAEQEIQNKQILYEMANAESEKLQNIVDSALQILKGTSLPKEIHQKLCTLVHTQWSIWQEHQDKQKIQNNAGTVEFTDGTWQNWNRLSNTPFKFLTPEEQKSDLEIAEKLWMPFLVEVISEERKSLRAALEANP